jgi:hypothetical protein
LFKFKLTNVTYCQCGLLKLEHLYVEPNFDFLTRYVKFPEFILVKLIWRLHFTVGAKKIIEVLSGK